MTTKASKLFAIALALIAFHLLDDNLLQPEPGTSAADHLLSGLLSIPAGLALLGRGAVTL